MNDSDLGRNPNTALRGSLKQLLEFSRIASQLLIFVIQQPLHPGEIQKVISGEIRLTNLDLSSQGQSPPFKTRT